MTEPTADFEERTRTSFARQAMMATLGAKLEVVEAGRTEISAPVDPRFTQQHGFVHAGFITTLLDVACGYAAYTLMPDDAQVLTAEFKSNFLAPGSGSVIRAIGTVIKPGRTLMVCRSDAYADDGDAATTHIATMQATMMVVRGRPDVAE